jgi:hypothetical protein
MADKDIQITFANYNVPFEGYFNYLKDVVVRIIEEKNLINNLNTIKQFIHEYDYGISDIEKRVDYHSRINRLERKIEEEDIIKIINLNKEKGEIKRSENTKLYFSYLIKMLNVLSEFVSELTSSFMPRTNLQKKKVQWASNQYFFQKFGDIKKMVNTELASFKLSKFSQTYKVFIVYFYVYKSYSNESSILNSNKLLSIALSYYCHPSLSSLFRKYPSFSIGDKKEYQRVSSFILSCLSSSNSILNQSFSKIGILPRINERKLIDVTGI